MRIHDPGVGAIQLKGDDCRVEACAERVQNCPCHRQAIVCFDHGRHIWQHHRDGVVLADAGPVQSGGYLSALRIVYALCAMNDCDG